MKIIRENIACDIAHTAPHNIMFIDDQLMFVEAAISMGIHGYHFQGFEPAKLFIQKIKSLKQIIKNM